MCMYVTVRYKGSSKDEMMILWIKMQNPPTVLHTEA